MGENRPKEKEPKTDKQVSLLNLEQVVTSITDRL
jgi:hypothetical protein